MGDGLGLRRWMYRAGGVDYVVLRDSKPHPEAVEVPDEWINEVARAPQAFALRPNKDPHSKQKQCVERRRKVRLSLSAPTFDADGKDFVEFMVIPEIDKRAGHIPLPEMISFTVNGERFSVEPEKPWPLASPLPGVFVFRLDDPCVWANPDERRTEAV